MLWSLLAGVGGTLAGALIPVSVRGRGEKLLSALMAFTAGFMAALVFFDVLPESLDSTGQIWITLLVTLAGAGIVFLAGILLDRKAGEHRHDDSGDLPDLHSAEGKRELYVGFSLMTALILHNIPEGMMIGRFVRKRFGVACGGAYRPTQYTRRHSHVGGVLQGGR